MKSKINYYILIPEREKALLSLNIKVDLCSPGNIEK